MVSDSTNQEKVDVIADVCRALEAGDAARVAAIARRYPHAASLATARGYSEYDCMMVFLRDHFTDRYSGARLFNPGVLRLLSHQLSESFPFHKNWKASKTHPMYWELFPTLDHRQAVSRQGGDELENWVTTSMIHNSAKAHWTVAELGWRELPIDETCPWDGMTGWLIDYARTQPEVRAEPYIARWIRASERALKESRRLVEGRSKDQ